MHFRFAFSLLVPALSFGAAGAGTGSGADDLASALALERTMQKVIRDLEPCVACILVSRSDAYERYGQGPSAAEPGKLGAFSPLHLELPPSLSQDEREAVRKKLDLSDPGHVPEAFGSGVVIGAKGLILTNYHVVRGATKVFVRLPGDRGGYADIHAADPRSDLAVLRLLQVKPPLKVMLRSAGGQVERGQFVLSLAHPFAAGFRDGQPSASWGIISNIRRRAPGQTREDERAKSLHQFGTLLQTDARLHLGCSGGALVNLKGEMIGLSTATAAIQGGETPGGFAVPMDAAMQRIVDVLARGEEVEYGFLGVGFDRPPRGDGVELGYVTPGSPAERDGRLQPRDVILAVNGKPVRDSDDLFLFLGSELAGTKVSIDVRRGHGRKETVAVTLGKFWVPGPRIVSSLGARPFFRGLRVDDTSVLAQQSPRRLRIPAGVLVGEVKANTPSATAQLKPGEVISHVNGRPVTSPAEFYLAVRGQTGPVELTLASFSPNAPPSKVTLN